MVEYVHILSLAVSWTIDIGDVERYGDPCCLRETQPRPCHHMSSMSCAAGSNVSSPLNSQFSVAQVSRTSFVDFVGLDDLDDLDDLDEDDEVSRSHLKCLSNNYTKTWDFSGSQRLYNINQTIYSVCLNMFEWRMKYVTHTHDIADIVKHIQITCPASMYLSTIIYILGMSWFHIVHFPPGCSKPSLGAGWCVNYEGFQYGGSSCL